MRIKGLTNDELICRKILLEVRSKGYPTTDIPHCLDWLCSLDILQPPDQDNKWRFGKGYPMFKKYINKHYFGDDL